MNRREACALLAATLGSSLAGFRIADATAAGIGPGQMIELRDMLNKGLLARRKVEFAFTDKVVALVADGTLSQSIVKSTFQWARRKRSHRYVYFENALRRRAKKELNVDL